MSEIKSVLSGNNAFYNRGDYFTAAEQEFAKKEPLDRPIYTWESEHIVTRVAKQILSIVIFPVFVYQLLHSFIGKVALLPASSPSLMGYRPDHADASRRFIPLLGPWKYKRITLDVDGYKIDAMIVGKPSTFNNKRWVLASLGNGEFYENKFEKGSDFLKMLTLLEGNGIVFNYPSVGASSGMPSRQAMAKAYRAVLSFLEDEEKGIGAKEIIAIGHSMGGGVQGDALNEHPLKDDVKYVFVKSRTYSSISNAASSMVGTGAAGHLVNFFGWNVDPSHSSKKLQAPEIILQTADVPYYQPLSRASQIRHDGVIPQEASLAKALLEDNSIAKANKCILGIPERHNEELSNPDYLATLIKAKLFF